LSIRISRAAVAVTATSGLVLGGVGLADAATTKNKKRTKHSAVTSQTTTRGNETLLTGDTAQQAKDAAVAAVPGTASRASTEDPSDTSGAKYEVHVTKVDGSDVEVLLDSAFKVIAQRTGGRGHGDHHGGRGGRGPGAESELTGDTATQAKEAALAAVAGTAWRASAEDPSDASGAKYEVHVTKADGSEVEVLLDSAFKVIATNASPQHARG
jgi:uncharacterized membrane protein YkoI